MPPHDESDRARADRLATELAIQKTDFARVLADNTTLHVERRKADEKKDERIEGELIGVRQSLQRIELQNALLIGVPDSVRANDARLTLLEAARTEHLARLERQQFEITRAKESYEAAKIENEKRMEKFQRELDDVKTKLARAPRKIHWAAITGGAMGALLGAWELFQKIKESMGGVHKP